MIDTLRHFPIGAAGLLSLLLAAVPTNADADDAIEVPLIYVGPPDSSALKGVLQGIEEGNQQGRFLGQRYVLEQRAPGAIATKIEETPAAIFAAIDAAGLRALSDSHPDIAIFNLTEPDTGLRADCRSNLLHVLPDRQMAADAVGQWRQKNPNMDVDARAWHPTFEKYAGRQLNDRFQKSFQQGMDDLAWSGWAATKMLTDSVARTQSAEATTLLRYLRENLEFDGQKGVTMNFRPNGQLRQVLLLVRDDQVVGEAPVKGVAEVEDLDSLGPTQCAVATTAQQ
jgi:hypothetical protein